MSRQGYALLIAVYATMIRREGQSELVRQIGRSALETCWPAWAVGYVPLNLDREVEIDQTRLQQGKGEVVPCVDPSAVFVGNVTLTENQVRLFG